MFDEAFDLAPGEVAADRYDPADAAETPTPASAAAVAEWEANPWF